MKSKTFWTVEEVLGKFAVVNERDECKVRFDTREQAEALADAKNDLSELKENIQRAVDGALYG